MTKNEWLFSAVLGFLGMALNLLLFLILHYPFSLFAVGFGCGIGLMSLARWRDTE